MIKSLESRVSLSSQVLKCVTFSLIESTRVPLNNNRCKNAFKRFHTCAGNKSPNDSVRGCSGRNLNGVDSEREVFS